MLGLILLYWIGKCFYKLAEKYEKNKWGFTILGIAVYYAGIFILGFILVIIIEIFSPGYFESMNEMVLNLIALPLGLLCCYLLYKYLEKTWENNNLLENGNLDQIGKSQE